MICSNDHLHNFCSIESIFSYEYSLNGLSRQYLSFWVPVLDGNLLDHQIIDIFGNENNTYDRIIDVDILFGTTNGETCFLNGPEYPGPQSWNATLQTWFGHDFPKVLTVYPYIDDQVTLDSHYRNIRASYFWTCPHPSG